MRTRRQKQVVSTDSNRLVINSPNERNQLEQAEHVTLLEKRCLVKKFENVKEFVNKFVFYLNKDVSVPYIKSRIGKIVTSRTAKSLQGLFRPGLIPRQSLYGRRFQLFKSWSSAFHISRRSKLDQAIFEYPYRGLNSLENIAKESQKWKFVVLELFKKICLSINADKMKKPKWVFSLNALLMCAVQFFETLKTTTFWLISSGAWNRGLRCNRFSAFEAYAGRRCF